MISMSKGAFIFAASVTKNIGAQLINTKDDIILIYRFYSGKATMLFEYTVTRT